MSVKRCCCNNWNIKIVKHSKEETIVICTLNKEYIALRKISEDLLRALPELNYQRAHYTPIFDFTKLLPQPDSTVKMGPFLGKK